MNCNILKELKKLTVANKDESTRRFHDDVTIGWPAPMTISR